MDEREGDRSFFHVHIHMYVQSDSNFETVVFFVYGKKMFMRRDKAS